MDASRLEGIIGAIKYWETNPYAFFNVSPVRRVIYRYLWAVGLRRRYFLYRAWREENRIVVIHKEHGKTVGTRAEKTAKTVRARFKNWDAEYIESRNRVPDQAFPNSLYRRLGIGRY